MQICLSVSFSARIEWKVINGHGWKFTLTLIATQNILYLTLQSLQKYLTNTDNLFDLKENDNRENRNSNQSSGNKNLNDMSGVTILNNNKNVFI